jgi:DDE superfamily endonuclease
MAWMIITLDEAFKSDKFTTLLGAFIQDADGTVLLIQDTLPVHQSRSFKAQVEKRKVQIELSYLSSHSPELNPKKLLSAKVEHALGAMPASRSKPTLEAAVDDHITLLK